MVASSAGHTKLYGSQLCWLYQSIWQPALLDIPIYMAASFAGYTNLYGSQLY
jgi:hypothetical protein